MTDQAERYCAARVAALAAKSGVYPSMETAVEIVPSLSMAMEAQATVHEWIHHSGLAPVTPDRLKVVVAEFIAACVAQDVDPFQVIPHMHASTHRVLDRWRDIHRRSWDDTASNNPTTTRRAS